jgi:hypothetical protein
METITINGTAFCATCYKQASLESNGSETLGQLAYDYLHYEYNHLTENQRAELIK